MSYEEEDTYHMREQDMAPTSLSTMSDWAQSLSNYPKTKKSFPMLGSLAWGSSSEEELNHGPWK